MKNYEDKEKRNADLAILAVDHRFGALLDLLGELHIAESVIASDPNIASDHGRLAFYVGRMDCYRLIKDHLTALAGDDDT
tara:strand:- start:8938 stop:9177 length:240 start_codon:yes stop_codon:yes gene_type:complete